jgi:sugar phosphate isomerase/epimerase
MNYLQSRRKFLNQSTLKVAGLAALSRRVLPADPLGLPIGLELYTVRNELEKDFAGTIKKVAAIGYKEVELYAFLNKPAAEIRQTLADNGLVCPVAHYDLSLEPRLAQEIEYANNLGLKYMVVAWLKPEERKSLDQYKRYAEFFNRAGAETKKAGIQFGYHNHNFEFKKFGGVVAFDELLRLTDPQLVKIELDCFWMTWAGRDPIEYMKRDPGRYPILHVKDRKPGFGLSTDVDDKPGPFTEVGHGIIDWKPIFGAASPGVKHYFVEQDFCDGPPLESARISYEYLKHLS